MSAGDTEEKFVRWKVDLVRKFFKANRGEEEVKKMIEESKGVGILSTTKSEGKVCSGNNALRTAASFRCDFIFDECRSPLRGEPYLNFNYSRSRLYRS